MSTDLKIYIDTNIALDYVTKRNSETVDLIDGIKKQKGEFVISSFLVMEMSDYKKNDIFIKKCLRKKWEVRKILREVNNQKGKNLSAYNYETIDDWQYNVLKDITSLKVYDFIQDTDDWELSQFIATNSELSAPDSIHLTSAIIGSFVGECRYMVTNDSLLITEGKRIIKNFEIIEGEFEILTIAEAKQKFFPK